LALILFGLLASSAAAPSFEVEFDLVEYFLKGLVIFQVILSHSFIDSYIDYTDVTTRQF
jgi:hypothetical protein